MLTRCDVWTVAEPTIKGVSYDIWNYTFGVIWTPLSDVSIKTDWFLTEDWTIC
jgi:hypothetical protein